MANYLRKKIQNFLNWFKNKYGYSFAWFIRYAIGGTLTTIAEWGVYYALYKPFGVNYLTASAIANIVSYIVNYILSKYYVFHSPDSSHKHDLTLFVLCSISNLVVMTLLVKFTVGILRLNKLAGRIIANVAAYIVVFIFKRYVIWNDTNKY